jgi:hypothetical protein
MNGTPGGSDAAAEPCTLEHAPSAAGSSGAACFKLVPLATSDVVREACTGTPAAPGGATDRRVVATAVASSGGKGPEPGAFLSAPAASAASAAGDTATASPLISGRGEKLDVFGLAARLGTSAVEVERDMPPRLPTESAARPAMASGTLLPVKPPSRVLVTGTKGDWNAAVISAPAAADAAAGSAGGTGALGWPAVSGPGGSTSALPCAAAVTAAAAVCGPLLVCSGPLAMPTTTASGDTERCASGSAARAVGWLTDADAGWLGAAADVDCAGCGGGGLGGGAAAVD